MTPLPDRSYPCKSLAADHASFDTLVRRNYRRIYAFALRLTRCPVNAEDLTQETFLRAFSRFHTYDSGRPLLNWLTRITYTLYIDSIRNKRTPHTVSLDAVHENAYGEMYELRSLADSRNDPQQALLKQTLDERLEHALASLPADFRIALLLCNVEGLSYEQIARRMGCSPGTVGSRVHRGRALLQRALLTPPERAGSARGKAR